MRKEGKVFDQRKRGVEEPSPACDGVRAVRRNEGVEHREAWYKAGHFHVKRAMRQLRVVRGFHNDVGVKIGNSQIGRGAWGVCEAAAVVKLREEGGGRKDHRCRRELLRILRRYGDGKILSRVIGYAELRLARAYAPHPSVLFRISGLSHIPGYR